MKNRLLFILLTLVSLIGFGQNSKKNILYIVDSIPIIKEPKEGFGFLKDNEIERVEIVKEKKIIKSKGYKDLDEIIYVFTKAYTKRPDSIKVIPTTSLMVKRNGTWYMKNSTIPYTGKFIDYYLNGKKEGEGTLIIGRLSGTRKKYHLNGNLFYVFEYRYGISNGIEERYREDGSLIQKGYNKNGKRIGVWEMFHPNGQLQLRSTYNDDGKQDGESISYYSTGKEKGKDIYKNGFYQKNKTNDKITEYYNQGQDFFYKGKYKSAIKKYTKCLEINKNWADAYFARGTAKLEDLQFDEAIKDFDETLNIEPYYTFAYSNRAFVIIRKYQLDNSRVISKSKKIQILASKETKIPESELKQVCEDLRKAVSLGDDNAMVLEAFKKYCKE